jgi:hypothetical protein
MLNRSKPVIFRISAVRINRYHKWVRRGRRRLERLYKFDKLRSDCVVVVAVCCYGWGLPVLRLFCVLAIVAFVAPLATRAEASVLVQIDRSVQRMSVSIDGVPQYNWRVSTARRGYITPPGSYHPQMLARRWFSRKYYNSPMPHSIFFYGGFAIHGSYEISQLGRPASHGCVRLDPANAAILYGLVERQGMDATTIVIH